jgi:hypothetical protein
MPIGFSVFLNVIHRREITVCSQNYMKEKKIFILYLFDIRVYVGESAAEYLKFTECIQVTSDPLYI